EAESRIFQIAESGARLGQGLLEIKPVLARVFERIDHLYHRDNPSDVTGVPTGFIDLDRMTAGLQPGDLIILAGRPSTGKTALARLLNHQYAKLSLIVIYYLQLMAASAQCENRATEISEISRSLKAMSKELDVPVIALSQLNRAVDQRPDRRPVMSDLRESGAIEQDADVIMFIYREVVYKPDLPEEQRGLAEVVVGKQRNGPIGTVKLTFRGQHTRFENYQEPGSYS